MEISKRQANEIVKTLREVIHEDINFITPNGIIIASSNEERIGDFHAGAMEVVKTKKILLINSETQFEGTKKGINIPIFLEGNLIAVMGITGEESKISQFSHIVAKMSEILIKEHFFNQQRQFNRENNKFLMSLILDRNVDVDLRNIRALDLGYDTSKFKYFVKWKINNVDNISIENQNHLFNSIEKRINHRDLLTRQGTDYIQLTYEDDFDSFNNNLETVKLYIESKYNINVTVGVSRKIVDNKNIYDAYLQANSICRSMAHICRSKIIQFKPDSVSFLFQGISSFITKSFSDNILQVYKPEEIIETKNMIYSYIHHNGSIAATANELYIHKNTLQYRLNKIASKTGINPRTLDGLITLYIAFEIHESRIDF